MSDFAALAEAPNSGSRTALAYVHIRDRIISGDLIPGTWLRERDLSSELNMSRVPIREALVQLEADGFTTVGPRHGAVVRQMTIQDVNEVFDIRLSIEVSATSIAARQVSEGADPARLLEVMAHAESLVSSEDEDLRARTNVAIHDEIFRLTGNELLTSVIRPVANRMRWLFGNVVQQDASQLCREHGEICQAICSGQTELASALAVAHIEHSRGPAISQLEGRIPRHRPGPTAP
ncbi:GntR family transcriptional regulator [Paenarthrobacter sp. NPDC092416]|uniref:GntR family transcriptional regulator n=1 Tax=Paenarthrobacter sp. NPDC092416 TaxID=3364386 RepID=UPI003813CE94